MKKILSLFALLVACNSEKEVLEVNIVTPDGNDGLDGIIAISILETYDDTTWILDFEESGRIDTSCDYRSKNLQYISTNKIEFIQYAYRICDNENVCKNKASFYEETKMKQREPNSGYSKITDIAENSFIVGYYNESDDKDYYDGYKFEFENNQIKMFSLDVGQGETLVATYDFLENGKSTFNDALSRTCNATYN